MNTKLILVISLFALLNPAAQAAKTKKSTKTSVFKFAQKMKEVKSEEYLIVARCKLDESTKDDYSIAELYKKRGDATQGLFLVENSSDIEVKVGNDVALTKDGDTYTATLKESSDMSVQIDKKGLKVKWGGKYVSAQEFSCVEFDN